ncbi:hypothetical protein CK218_22240 [Mesorhizobium sp. WSM3879]|uniref:hypothetical protein n=1 Tax=Mesorhizobium sp. WSM3879 TaxID=2029406 RepID=UPI000BAF713A|nr:hypothetical protein [Mesorhizobium sp. WSM3879]PBB79072.1 hypothetical protein CK218_22240 [Mesorhizobium sp. WSM3879]
MTGAERMRKHRQRLREGTMPIVIDVDAVNLSAFLVAAGHLAADLAEDREAIRAAAEIWIARATCAAAYESVTLSRRALLKSDIDSA